MRLYLIRHGQTDSNLNHLLDTAHPGAPLNPTGLGQAEQLADRLGAEPIEAVYSSDLTRAAQSAGPLAARLGLPVRQLPGLREIAAGVEENSTDWTTYVRTLERWAFDPQAQLAGGENASTFLGRYDAAITQIAAAHRVAAAVSHGAALRVWVPLRANNLVPGSGGQLQLPNVAVIVLEGDPASGWTVLTWADKPV